MLDLPLRDSSPLEAAAPPKLVMLQRRTTVAFKEAAGLRRSSTLVQDEPEQEANFLQKLIDGVDNEYDTPNLKTCVGVGATGQFSGDALMGHGTDTNRTTVAGRITATWSVVTEPGESASNRARKKVNQDAWVVVEDLNDKVLFGICDGHGRNGRNVAAYVAAKMPSVLSSTLSFKGKKYNEAMRFALPRVHQQLEIDGIEHTTSGTTGSFVLLDNKETLTVGSVGDSMVLIGQVPVGVGGRPIVTQLNMMHHPEDPDEAKRIQAIIDKGETDTEIRPMIENGQYVGPPRLWIDGMGLNLTRTIGDSSGHHGRGLIAEPDVATYRLDQSDKYLVLVSDGVYEFMEEDEIMGIVHRGAQSALPPHKVARNLVATAQLRWRKEDDLDMDDCTAIVVYLNVPETAEQQLLADYGTPGNYYNRRGTADNLGERRRSVVRRGSATGPEAQPKLQRMSSLVTEDIVDGDVNPVRPGPDAQRLAELATRSKARETTETVATAAVAVKRWKKKANIRASQDDVVAAPPKPMPDGLLVPSPESPSGGGLKLDPLSIFGPPSSPSTRAARLTGEAPIGIGSNLMSPRRRTGELVPTPPHRRVSGDVRAPMARGPSPKPMRALASRENDVNTSPNRPPTSPSPKARAALAHARSSLRSSSGSPLPDNRGLQASIDSYSALPHADAVSDVQELTNRRPVVKAVLPARRNTGGEEVVSQLQKAVTISRSKSTTIRRKTTGSNEPPRSLSTLGAMQRARGSESPYSNELAALRRKYSSGSVGSKSTGMLQRGGERLLSILKRSAN